MHPVGVGSLIEYGSAGMAEAAIVKRSGFREMKGLAKIERSSWLEKLNSRIVISDLS